MCRSAFMASVVRTNVGLWRKVAFTTPPPSWDERNRTIAGFITDGSSVLDLGCGAQPLKQHLKPGCRYQPCDVIQSSPEVIFCDFNSEIYPDIKERFDYVVCSGVLEYIRQPKKFLQKVPQLGRTVFLSYVPLVSGGSKLERLGNGWGWVNHFTRDELEWIFADMGLKWVVIHTDKSGYLIYSLSLENAPLAEDS